MLLRKPLPQDIMGHPSRHQYLRIAFLEKYIRCTEDIDRLNLYIVILGQTCHNVLKYLL